MAIPDPTPAATPTNSKRKRQDNEGEGSTRPKKTNHGGIWANLDVILSLQRKDLDLQRKIEFAFDFVTSEANRRSDRGPVSVPLSRLASFLSEWIQPLLISSGHSRKSSELSDPCLDFRCWVVLRFCLDHSSVVAVSPNLLRAVARVSQHAVLAPDCEESTQLFEKVLECLSLLLSCNARAFSNAGAELWVSSAAEIAHLIRRVMPTGQPNSPFVEVLLTLSGLMLEHLASFLRFNSNPRNVFLVFVDRLLEPSLELLVLLHLRADGGECGRVISLSRMVEDILSNGLFHPVHISGFLSLRTSGTKQEARESKGINESYHRHLFRKLEKIISEKKAMALGGFGSLFRMFVSRVKARKRTSLSSKGNRTSGRGNEVSEEIQETSKPLFDVFVQFMEPLLLECRRLAENEFFELGEVTELRLVEAHCMLKSLNEMLLSFIQEKIYVRVEDTSEGAHFNFLKEVYETITSISSKFCMLWLSALPADGTGVKKMLQLISREVVAAVGCFLEIEYKVVGDDVVKLWLVMLSYLAASMSSEENKPGSLLTSEILNLGCKLINIYSELRQVDCPIFALCKAMRLFVIAGDAGDVGSSMFVSSKSLSCQIRLRSAATLLCSQEFRRSISNAVNSIPEGQASGCITQLNIDIMNSLEWMKASSLKPVEEVLDLNSRADLLGKIMSDIYTIVLDSIPVTATSSVLIGNSIKNLMQTISPSYNNLVQTQSDNVDEGVSWIFVFFFRMYVSCRSLYRQSISLMPPGSAKKAAIAMGNLFTVSCGMDWRETPGIMDEGYFVWIAKSTISLPDVIKTLAEGFLSRTFASYAPLVYVILVMALQRLGDLNRLIKAFKFLKERDNLQELNTKWKQLVKVSRQEAAELTTFMTGYLAIFASEGESGETTKTSPSDEDAWDLVVCSLNEASLPTAIWRLLCRNTDIWCVHATDKNLKEFLSHLFHYLLPCGSTCTDLRKQNMSSSLYQKVTLHHISLEFVGDTALYEQTVLYKHFASSFCLILKKSLSLFIGHGCTSETDISSLLDWSAVLNILEKGTTIDKDEGQSLSSLIVEFRTCENLLNLLCKVLGVFVTDESFPLYANYIINLERLLVSNLLSYHSESSTNHLYDLLSLFKSCRRAMKYLVVASVEGNSAPKSSSFFSNMFNSSSSILWLMKSVSEIVGLPHDFFGEKNPIQVKEMIFSLIDHTSSIFFMISESTMSPLVSDDYNPTEQDTSIKYLELVAETLKEQTTSLQDAIKMEACTTVFKWNKLSSMVSCLQGFLWGLASGLDSIHEDQSIEESHPSIFPCISKLSNSIAVYEDFVHLCLNILFINDIQEAEVLYTPHDLPETSSVCANSIANVLRAFHKIDLSKLQDLKGPLLRSLLIGENPHIAFTLRELFMASAAILKLRCMLPFSGDSGVQTSRSMAILLGTSHLVLQEMSEMVGSPDPFTFIWLDGVIKFLGVIGSNIKDTKPNLSKDVYALLIDTHLRAIGKCITLEGKAATLSSHEIGSNTKMLLSQSRTGGSGVLSIEQGYYIISSFKARLRMSFKEFISRPRKLHLKIVVQTLERALVGVQKNCNMVHEINTGDKDGGRVSSIVAAGIDCLDLVLESVSGKLRAGQKHAKQRNDLVKNIPSLISAIFNIVLHLQNPAIFYLEKLPRDKSEVNPDAGSIVVMCVEVLTKVAGNYSFELYPCHVSQFLHIPMPLFQNFHQLGVSRVANIHQHVVDRQFSIDLYASCCRLLCTTLKHQKGMVARCIALLENSVSTLLSCLETVESDLVGGKGYFGWEVQEAIKCASFLRRIYEEIRQQKDLFGRYSTYFLSTYISIYSGYGPLKTGIKRDIDEALRPGVYSLVDICTPDDLQQLHTLLGEGPCRSTLATLLHDYKLNFQFEGKI